MNIIKKAIIMLLIFLVIISIIVFFVMNIKEDTNDAQKEFEEHSQYSNNVDKSLHIVNLKSDYYTVKNCLDIFIQEIKELGKRNEYIELYEYTEEEFDQKIQDSLDIIYCMLGEEYIKQYDITRENVLDTLSEHINAEYLIDEMHEKSINSNISMYLINARRVENSNITEYKFIIKLDLINSTFSIYPYKFFKEKENNENLLNDNIIQDKVFNKYENVMADNEVEVQGLFTSLKNNLIYDLDKLYSILDKEYSKKNFQSIESFKNYVSKNYNRLSRSIISKYKVNEYDDYTEYICIDTNGKYYIFKEKGIMEYSIMLDNYTVDLPQFLEKYNKSTDQEKVVLNINKFISGINDKNYNYMYNLLAETFKNNKYDTQEKFEREIENNFFDNNSVKYSKFSQEGNNYIYELEISDATKNSNEIKKCTIIMQLKEGTDFVMSFSL